MIISKYQVVLSVIFVMALAGTARVRAESHLKAKMDTSVRHPALRLVRHVGFAGDRPHRRTSNSSRRRPLPQQDRRINRAI